MEKEMLRKSLSGHNLRQLISDLPQTVEGYEHANGFAKITLTSGSSSGVTIRAHFWDPALGAAGSVGAIHNHRWNFCSRILRGAVTVRHLALDPGGETFRHYVYRQGPIDQVDFVGYQRLAVVREEEYETEDTYFESHKTIHEVQPSDGSMAVTLIAHGEVMRQTADVYTRADAPRVGARAASLQREVFDWHVETLKSLVMSLNQ